jgi:hypothetical protein
METPEEKPPLDIAELLRQIEEERKHMKMMDDPGFFPVEVKDIKFLPPFNLVESQIKPGTFVSVRPCSEDDGKKTFLGIFLGDLFTMDPLVAYDTRNGQLRIVAAKTNPAMFVPDLGRIVWGYESWWGEIESPDQLRQITDEDIQNVWYVKAMEQMTKKEGGE